MSAGWSPPGVKVKVKVKVKVVRLGKGRF